MHIRDTMQRRSRGFTIVELLIVIVVIAVLAAVVIVAYSGIQSRARDTKRQHDTQSIARALEAYYVLNGSYPPFQQPGDIGLNSATWRAANLSGVTASTLTPPGATAVSLVNNATPTTGQYGYRNGESCIQCPRFFLYWRSEADNQIKTILSQNGH